MYGVSTKGMIGCMAMLLVFGALVGVGVEHLVRWIGGHFSVTFK